MATKEIVTRDYCMKNNINENDLSAQDEKVINVILKVRTSYATQLEKRKCTILLEKPPQSYETKSEQSIVTQAPSKPTKKPKVDAEPCADVLMCKAVTMKGTACKSKAKPGCEFCGKHMPK